MILPIAPASAAVLAYQPDEVVDRLILRGTQSFTVSTITEGMHSRPS